MAGTWREWRLPAILLFLLAAWACKGALLQPPAPPEAAASGEFDTARALARLERMLGDQRPHPVDTPANDQVRARLAAELRALGLEPQVREATDCSGFPRSRTVSCSHVRNVVAVIAGGPSNDALLLNAHYDSTPTGPGAADDGIGVATLLEVAYHLRRERPARPVILLFNEGEEYGLNGAAVFAEQDPLARSVGRLINIEARGVSGPVIMFETSRPNGLALSDYAAATRRPYANSLSADFARLIPNSTDVVKFKPKGWETLSYAITGNETRYHSPGDDLAHLDRASVGHMGSEVLAAARRLSGPSTPAARAPVAYSDIGGRVLVAVPLLMGAVLLAGLVAVAAVIVARRRAWKPLAALAVAVAAATIAAGLVATVAGLAKAGDYWRAYPWLTTLAVAATVLAVEAWLVVRAAQRHDRTQLRLAAWALILLLGGAISLFMPGALIYFLIGPALGLLGLRWAPLAWLGGLVQLVMLAELVALIELTLIDGPVWAVAPLVAIAALPLLAETGRDAPRKALIAAFLVALGLWVAALLMPRASPERPLAFTLDHVQDERTGKAVWAAATKQAPLPASWDRFGPWRAGPLPYNKRRRWLAPAPAVEGPRGGLRLLSSDADGDGRRVRLRLDRAGADSLLLRFGEDVPVQAMGLAGRARRLDPEADKGPSILRCTGRRCDGLEVEVLLGTAKPVTAMLVAQRFAPPREAAPLLAARPANAHPQYSPDSQVRVRGVRF
jgi:hypothetical protein